MSFPLVRVSMMCNSPNRLLSHLGALRGTIQKNRLYSQSLKVDPPPIYVTCKDLAKFKYPPRATQCLVRDFISDSLTNPYYGYFTRQAAIFSPSQTQGYPFNQFRDSMSFMTQLSRDYKDYESQLEYDVGVDDPPPQVWHTPSEIFKPWYGYAIANHCVKQYMLQGYPQSDLIIYELGGGNGTLMSNVLDFIQAEHGNVYERTQYHIIEVSAQLAERQRKLLESHSRDHREKVTIHHKGIADWKQVVNEDCFFLALEVIDNLPQDLVRYDPCSEEPFQALVVTSPSGEYSLEYTPVTDPLISEFLRVRASTAHPHPVLGKVPQSLRRLAWHLPFSANLTRGEFLATGTFDFIQRLHRLFPRHRLVLSDFFSLPDPIEGYYGGPVVQTRWKGDMIPCSTFLVKPGCFDIFFPTNFEVLRDMYTAVENEESKMREVGHHTNARFPRVLSHSEFLKDNASLDDTTTKSGENPMLGFYENVKFLLS